MSHSARKRLVPSKVKVKVRGHGADSHLADSVTPMDEDHPGGKTTRDGKNAEADIGAPVEWLGYHPIALKKEAGGTPTCNNNIYSNGKQDFREQSSPLSLSDRCGVNQEAGQDETSSNGNKDDEDDDDDESEDKIDTQTHDPERLKAFNMFVRLFVDENLDRMVPISKQPKEKIQAIIDSCTRQFPEFAERARKRIRTYLKSCRRNKRSRDSNGWESSRPTPAHLTSVQAEQILAQACENESQNAKRMRMGLEPVGQPLPVPQSQQSEKNSSEVAENGHGKASGGRSSSREDCDKSASASPEKERPSKVSSGGTVVSTVAVAAAAAAVVADVVPQNPPSQNTSQQGSRSPSSSSENQHPSGGIPAAPKAHDRSPLVDYSRALNGNGVPNMSMYRPNFGQAFQRPAPFPALFPPSAVSAATTAALPTFPHGASPLPITNDAGPTDLSMKAKPLLTHKLNATEMATVRQLITGYRESAAFLLRSADELEQLLIQQQ
ncbi:unnamed protein product [Allacma fusca]|uniref:Nucleolar protein 4 helical domain-containing protein n=1 Tax=Allacma fusca TaxID=39272 RepID=A0A8J2ME94_9HEXA|nr:unnamed protein product [Allacma fusca]